MFEMIIYILLYIPNLVYLKVKANFKPASWVMSVMNSTRKVTLKKPSSGFWADPFIISKENNHYIFFEDYKAHEQKGIISCITLDNDLNTLSSGEIIEEPYHLSYPMIMELQGEFYIVPESKSNSQIRLYKCIEFPYTWRFEKTLIDNIKAVDSTIVFYENKFWLFCTIQTGLLSNASDVLVIYCATALWEEWTPHKQNPIRLDGISNRAAGSIYSKTGSLYRPVQNSRNGYGSAIDIYKIEELSINNYSEVFVESILPNKYASGAIGLHTINRGNNIEIIDMLTTSYK